MYKKPFSVVRRNREAVRGRFNLGKLRLSRILRWAVLLATIWWVIANYHEDIPVATLEKQYAFPDSRYIQVEGMKVHYRMLGKGEPIILLHDANNSLHTWNGWVDSLSLHYKVIALDLPGFGLTGPHPRGSYSTFMYVNFLKQFADSLQVRQFHLAGNGLGAQIAWFFAKEHPDRLRKLILLNAPGFEKSRFSLITFWASTPVANRVFRRITPRSFFKIILEDMYADDEKITEALVQRHFELFCRPGSRKAFTDGAQVRDNRPPAELIRDITVPTLILWGAEDTRISPEHAYDFHGKIRKSQLKIYQNTGHWPQEENPGTTAADARSFLEGRF